MALGVNSRLQKGKWSNPQPMLPTGYKYLGQDAGPQIAPKGFAVGVEVLYKMLMINEM